MFRNHLSRMQQRRHRRCLLERAVRVPDAVAKAELHPRVVGPHDIAVLADVTDPRDQVMRIAIARMRVMGFQFAETAPAEVDLTVVVDILTRQHQHRVRFEYGAYLRHEGIVNPGGNIDAAHLRGEQRVQLANF